jgi:hypothetical protein
MRPCARHTNKQVRARVRVRVQGEVLPVDGLIGGEERVPVVDHHDPEQLHLKKRKFSSECTTQKAGRQRVCVCVAAVPWPI